MVKFWPNLTKFGQKVNFLTSLATLGPKMAQKRTIFEAKVVKEVKKLTF